MTCLIRLIAAAALATACAGLAAAQGGPPPAPTVTVAPPLAKRITQWDEYWGRFKAVENVEIRARVSGFLDQVHFKDGALVKAGDLLFTIDKRPFQIAVENSKAEVARVEAQVALAENEVERAKPLALSKVLSDRDFDQRKAALKAAQAQLLSVKANLKAAELNLEWSEVRAPISGRISDKKIDAGNLITGGATGATLLTSIVSLRPIHFEFDVSESDYLRYRRLFLSGERPSSRDTANPVRAKLADEEDWIHIGKMDFVDNAFNERSGTLRGRAIFENEESVLTPGVFARLQLFGGDTDALLVPDASVVSDQARKIVFAVDAENKVIPVPVTLGPMVDGLRVIKSGLDASQRVIIDGLANPMVRPGAVVAPKDGEIKTADAKQ